MKHNIVANFNHEKLTNGIWIMLATVKVFNDWIQMKEL